jgi:hypothetical protein
MGKAPSQRVNMGLFIGRHRKTVPQKQKKQKGQSEDWPKFLILLVGAAGFELATPCTP